MDDGVAPIMKAVTALRAAGAAERRRPPALALRSSGALIRKLCTVRKGWFFAVPF
ncbi:MULTISPECIES: hypothetical protein [Methylobacterium]|uniref:hypothetical protein n=1 Tax=Methylobacterium TaxID=407 RepID=UPI002F35A80D